MLRTSFVSGGLVALALLSACSGGTQGAPEVPQPAPAAAPATPQPVAQAPATTRSDPTTRDGIYTVAQAGRGEEVFLRLCAECHDAVEWTEGAFQGRWQDQSTFQLWYYINDRMPYDNPWSLTRQQVTDVLAYILHLNNLPTGSEELGITDDDIDQYWIVWSH